MIGNMSEKGYKCQSVFKINKCPFAHAQCIQIRCLVIRGFTYSIYIQYCTYYSQMHKPITWLKYLINLMSHGLLINHSSPTVICNALNAVNCKWFFTYTEHLIWPQALVCVSLACPRLGVAAAGGGGEAEEEAGRANERQSSILLRRRGLPEERTPPAKGPGDQGCSAGGPHPRGGWVQLLQWRAHRGSEGKI